jgi:tetratricopeptide (TPR) repeat protein
MDAPRNPRFAEGWNQRASVLWQMGQYEKSIRDSERAVTLNPNHYGAWQGMGVCRLKLGEIVEACRCLRAALKIVPYDTPTREALESCEQLLQKRSPAPERVTGFELI